MLYRKHFFIVVEKGKEWLKGILRSLREYLIIPVKITLNIFNIHNQDYINSWYYSNYKTIKMQYFDAFVTIWNPKHLYNIRNLKAYMLLLLKFNFLAKCS